MILILIDAGCKLKVTDQSIYQLDPRWLDKTDAKAQRCSLWGLKPAGGMHIWSRTSVERMEDFVKKGSGGVPLWSKVSKVPKVPKVPSLFPFIPRLFHLGTFDTGLILLLVLDLIM